MDGAVGRSRANHVPRAISDSRTTRTSTPAKSVPSPSSQEFGSGALVEVDRPRGNSTTAQAMANSVNILLGVGLLSVPYALQQGGWAGLGVLGVLGVTTNYTGKILIRCQRRGSLPALDDSSGDALGTKGGTNDCGGAGAAARGVITDPDASSSMDSLSCDWDDPLEPTRRPLLSYEDVGEAAFGANGRRFITWVLYTELIGTCALFFILEGDHLEILFDHAHTQEWFMCAAAAVMIPTLWLSDLSSLSFIGGLGACASLSLVGVVLYELVAVGGFPHTLPPALETTALVHLEHAAGELRVARVCIRRSRGFPGYLHQHARTRGVRGNAGQDVRHRGRHVLAHRRRRVRALRGRRGGRGDAEPADGGGEHAGAGAGHREPV